MAANSKIEKNFSFLLFFTQKQPKKVQISVFRPNAWIIQPFTIS